MDSDLDGIVHNYEISAAGLPLYAVSAGVGQKLMPYAVETKVMEKLVAVPCSSADKPEASIYMLLEPNVASEIM